MKRRRQRIDKTCKMLLASTPSSVNSTVKEHLTNAPELVSIWINQKRKMAVCIPHKVGSQMWRYFFVKLDENDSGISENESRIQFQNEVPKDITDYYIAFQTRHPLERLLSSYRFVFERKEPRANVIGMIKDIFRLFPSNTGAETATYDTEQGVRIKEIRINNDKNEANINVEDSNINWFKVTPSFEQFVKYISDVDASGPDLGVSKYPIANHWVPYYMQCNPCYGGKYQN